jgi:hypothetical protein
VRVDPPEHRRADDRVGQCLLLGRQVAGVDQGIGAAEPHPLADRADRARVVAGDHLEGDALGGEEVERLVGVGADLILE